MDKKREYHVSEEDVREKAQHFDMVVFLHDFIIR